MTRSASRAASAAVACTESTSPMRRAVSRVAAVLAWPAMLRASPARRMAWLSEEPISPRPIRATRSNIGGRGAVMIVP